MKAKARNLIAGWPRSHSASKPYGSSWGVWPLSAEQEQWTHEKRIELDERENASRKLEEFWRDQYLSEPFPKLDQ